MLHTIRDLGRLTHQAKGTVVKDGHQPLPAFLVGYGVSSAAYYLQSPPVISASIFPSAARASADYDLMQLTMVKTSKRTTAVIEIPDSQETTEIPDSQDSLYCPSPPPTLEDYVDERDGFDDADGLNDADDTFHQEPKRSVK